MSTVIEGYIAGDDLDIERDVTGVTTTDPLVKAWLTIKTSPSVLDASASLQKVITTSAVPGVGGIAQDGGVSNGDGTASMTFQLTAAETLALGTTIKYFYDVQVKSTSGKIYTPEQGRLTFLRGLTDATT